MTRLAYFIRVFNLFFFVVAGVALNLCEKQNSGDESSNLSRFRHCDNKKIRIYVFFIQKIIFQLILTKNTYKTYKTY